VGYSVRYRKLDPPERGENGPTVVERSVVKPWNDIEILLDLSSPGRRQHRVLLPSRSRKVFGVKPPQFSARPQESQSRIYRRFRAQVRQAEIDFRSHRLNSADSTSPKDRFSNPHRLDPQE